MATTSFSSTIVGRSASGRYGPRLMPLTSRLTPYASLFITP